MSLFAIVENSTLNVESEAHCWVHCEVHQSTVLLAIVEIQPYTHLKDVDNSGNETEPGWLCWESDKCSQLNDVGMDCLDYRP